MLADNTKRYRNWNGLSQGQLAQEAEDTPSPLAKL
jgi:hypothetical protein